MCVFGVNHTIQGRGNLCHGIRYLFWERQWVSVFGLKYTMEGVELSLCIKYMLRERERERDVNYYTFVC